MFPLLSITLFLPLVAAVAVVALPSASVRQTQAIGLVASGLSLVGVIAVGVRGVPAHFGQIEEISWIPSLGAAYRVGIDGISYPLVLLSAILFVVALVFSCEVTDRTRAYVSLVLLLETASLGVFLALDLLLFYVFFEVNLVAMYFLIAGWGHAGRQRAALTFFLYTLIGSLPLLLAILALYLGAHPHTFDMRSIIGAPPLSGGAAMLVFLAFFIAFGIKTPLFPFHTWLPAAHVEAPTAGSVLLAGVLLKFGTYGFIRFALEMTPQAFHAVAPLVGALAVFSALYGAFAALAQTDLKRMVAYTSVNHMGYVILGIAAAAALGGGSARTVALDGATLQMVSHGIVTGALFLLVGMLQDRAGTREMGDFGGLLRVVPVLGWSFILAAFASLGLPALAHFPAEFQIFLGTFHAWPLAVGIVVIGIVVTAGLYLRAISVSFLGTVAERWRQMPDLGRRELWSLAPLLALTVLIGVAPGMILAIIHRTAELLP